MSPTEVSFTLAGSIVWTISCETVPAPTTGIAAVSVTCAPGTTVADDAVNARSGAEARTVPTGRATSATTNASIDNGTARQFDP